MFLSVSSPTWKSRAVRSVTAVANSADHHDQSLGRLLIQVVRHVSADAGFPITLDVQL